MFGADRVLALESLNPSQIRGIENDCSSCIPAMKNVVRGTFIP